MTILATEARQLIPVLCRQFSDATGWPLQFTPLDDGSGEELEARLREAPGCCWISEIEDGTGKIGFLRLCVPEYDGPTQNFLAVSDFAAGLAQLLSRFASATHRLESRTQEVTTLVNLGLSPRGEEHLPDALSQLLTAAVQLTGYRSAAFFLLSPGTNRLKLRAGHQLDPENLPGSPRDLAHSRPDLDALLNGPVFVRRDSAADQPWLPDDASSGLCAAVQSPTVPMGTLWVYDRRSRASAGPEAHLLKSVAAQIAGFLERVVLLRESETQHRLTSELRLASENQALPCFDNLPPTPGFEAAARYVSRHELGGDLCELIPLGDGRTGIALGDASGNSIPAALVMTAVRGGLRALPAGKDCVDVRPEQVMERLNQALHAITGPHQFMSLFYGVYDPRSRQLTYTNAGHPSPLLIRGGQVRPLDAHGLLLGVMPDATYDHSVLELAAGDLLVLYSDGISEAMSGSQKLFRADGIVTAILESESDSARSVLQSIWTQAELHAGGAKGLDDRTLLVLRFTGE